MLACGSTVIAPINANAEISQKQVASLAWDNISQNQAVSLASPSEVETKRIPTDLNFGEWFVKTSPPLVSVLAVDLATSASQVGWEELPLKTQPVQLAPGTSVDGTGPYLSQSTGRNEPSLWQLNFMPNVFFPVSDGGSNFNENITYGARFEAWNVANNVMFFIEPSYRDRGLIDTVVVDVPPPLQNRIPSEVRLDLDSQYLNVDVGLGYRFFDRVGTPPSKLATEFDIPEISFDIMAGARLFFSWNEVSAATNLGQTASASRQQTWAEPLVGARLRWNISDQVAFLLDGDVSGFGIGDLSFSWRAKGTLDWMFSGDTSLVAGYQVSEFDYTLTSGNNSLRYDILSHGPYLGLLFRF